jgi:hypothetical protein
MSQSPWRSPIRTRSFIPTASDVWIPVQTANINAQGGATLGGGAIAGISIAVIAAITGAVVLVFILLKRRSQKLKLHDEDGAHLPGYTDWNADDFRNVEGL